MTSHQSRSGTASDGRPAEGGGFDPGAEFDRQLARLLALGYPGLAGRTEAAFTELVRPLRRTVLALGPGMAAPSESRMPFLLVVDRTLAPVERTVPLTTLDGKARGGVVDRHYPAGDIERFAPVEGLGLPRGPVHLLLDADRGEEFCGVVPKDAMATVAGRGRSLLTMEEGIAFVTLHPRALARNRCFSLGGSRCGDRRVPALWISQGAPKLGWCWEGNPHTWLGMASAGGRAGAAS
ncbi:hypothetical protein GCM10010495_40300 [Kitasatospora herbaricolor]|uniref:DUF5701 family protein n=1 Tax=Kitasatospora herbaricolor TaxID=68217 RepID=UPI0019B54FFF|nr:DUF5701 family protein [Kitasatospora herbaricolor]MDQ0310195.1 hypothetical protein [Kitasatospora herbaricolor]GGV20944.1 hypothetical protein GCM10010495_40300 [Kitasatospora herbaricolor]